MDIKNKVILITGASKGIGASVATELAKKGASIVINYRGDTEAANNVLSKVNGYSSNNIAVKADICNETEVKEMFNTIKQKYGKLDILINNAGIFVENDRSTNLDAFHRIFNMNFYAQVLVTKYALELISAGKIVNISSVHGKLGHGNPHAIAYSALKAAFDSYTKNLAKDLAPNILVNGIAPGRTLTPMWGELSKQEQTELGEGQLIKRFINPVEIAHAIVFLLENDAMCGEIVTVDGGMSLKTLD